MRLVDRRIGFLFALFLALLVFAAGRAAWLTTVESRDLGGWREVIEPGALNGAKLDDLVATVDHVGIPIGRYPTTLELEDRADGAHWSVQLPESRSDVREAVERGDLRAGSWRMVVSSDECHRAMTSPTMATTSSCRRPCSTANARARCASASAESW